MHVARILLFVGVGRPGRSKKRSMNPSQNRQKLGHEEEHEVVEEEHCRVQTAFAVRSAPAFRFLLVGLRRRYRTFRKEKRGRGVGSQERDGRREKFIG
jgi:hypothetical protein